jgi:hypothetical protein
MYSYATVVLRCGGLSVVSTFLGAAGQYGAPALARKPVRCASSGRDHSLRPGQCYAVSAANNTDGLKIEALSSTMIMDKKSSVS